MPDILLLYACNINVLFPSVLMYLIRKHSTDFYLILTLYVSTKHDCVSVFCVRTRQKIVSTFHGKHIQLLHFPE